MTKFRTIARHIAAAIVAALAGWLTPLALELGVDQGQVDAALGSIEAAVTFAVMFAAYAVTEKLLKPLWYRRLGEKQVGDDPSTRVMVIALLLMGAPAVAQEATFTDVTVLRVVDGDTWDVRATLPVGVSFTARLRPLGLDCAEPRGDTRDVGLAQSGALEDLLFSASEHRLTVHGVDSFGRWLVDAWAGGVAVAPHMIEQGCSTYMSSEWR